jgi:osmoprotectant transport system permease protein
VLYALLPLIRNTVTGIESVDKNVREAAVAMGMSERQILWQVELPLALNVILAGVRVATVVSVGVATIAAAIGAGGLGAYIFRGLRQNDNTLVLAGALPAALLALVADWLLGLLGSHLDANRKRRDRTTGDERARVWRRVGFIAMTTLLISVGALVVWRGANPKSAVGADGRTNPAIRVGSKDFTESIILAEMLAQELEARGAAVERRYELGGNLCHDALVGAQIDAYPEYTGTSFTAILKHQPVSDARAVYETVKRDYADQFKVEVSAPLGFSNDFAILIRGADARSLNLRTISDATSHAPGWRAGFGQDFMSRAKWTSSQGTRRMDSSPRSTLFNWKTTAATSRLTKPSFSRAAIPSLATLRSPPRCVASPVRSRPMRCAFSTMKLTVENVPSRMSYASGGETKDSERTSGHAPYSPVFGQTFPDDNSY